MKNQYSLVLIALFISVFLPLLVNAQEVPVTANCSASPNAVYSGDSVTWDADASGGDGNYTYEWTINGESVSSSESFDTSYSADSGDQTYSVDASVTVTDGLGVTDSANCDVTVIAPLTFGSCNANESATTVGIPITWDVNTTGGLGPNTYDWTGTDGLTGNEDNIEISYSTIGEKVASINSVSSDDGQTITGPFDCGSVDIYAVPGSLSASCAPTDSTVERNQTATWSANISGGNAPYSISWSGSDGLSGETESVNKVYTTNGSKTASIIVGSSDGQLLFDVSCSVLTVTNSGGGSNNDNDDDDDDSTATSTDSTASTTDDGTTGTGDTDTESNVVLSVVDVTNQSANEFALVDDISTTTDDTVDEVIGTTTDEAVNPAPNNLQAAAILAFLGSHPLGTTAGGIAIVLLILLGIFFLRKSKNTV